MYKFLSNIEIKFKDLLSLYGSQIFHRMLSLMLDLKPTNIALAWPSVIFRGWTQVQAQMLFDRGQMQTQRKIILGGKI